MLPSRVQNKSMYSRWSRDASMCNKALTQTMAMVMHLCWVEGALSKPESSYLRTESSQYIQGTGWCSDKALDLHSGGSQFESRPGHRISWPRCSLSSSVLPGNSLDITKIISPPLPSKYFLNCYSSFIPPFEALLVCVCVSVCVRGAPAPMLCSLDVKRKTNHSTFVSSAWPVLSGMIVVISAQSVQTVTTEVL